MEGIDMKEEIIIEGIKLRLINPQVNYPLSKAKGLLAQDKLLPVSTSYPRSPYGSSIRL